MSLLLAFGLAQLLAQIRRHNRFADVGLITVVGPMVQHRVHKTLGLAAASAGGYQGALGQVLRRQTLPSALLVRETRKLRLETFEKLFARRTRCEGQAQLQIWPLEPARRVFDKAGHDAAHEVVRRLETGGQELPEAFLNVFGQ